LPSFSATIALPLIWLNKAQIDSCHMEYLSPGRLETG
jgi:hypothetical protein